MPCTIQLSNLSWSTPDQNPLFTDLTLQFGPGLSGLVGRNGVGKTTLLHLIHRSLIPQAGQITCDGTTALLQQQAQPPAGQILADLFGAREALAILSRAEAGAASAEDLAAADWTLEARIQAALSRVGLDTTADVPLDHLSGGQQTRARLAALIFAEPDFLLLDEPTNNLDRAGREAVFDLLRSWKGGAIIVSHDRDLLEIMASITELTSLGATHYGGNYSFYQAQKSLELAAAAHDLNTAERHATEITRKRQTALERKARKDRTGRAKRARGDMPKIAADKAKARSEATGGAMSRLAEKQVDETQSAVTEAAARVERLTPLKLDLAPTGLASGQTVLKAQELTGGGDAEHPIIRDVSIQMTGAERVAITGPNGIGKSTLLNLLTGNLSPVSGTVTILPDHAMLDQHVRLLDPSLTLRDNFRALNPEADENTCRAALARFLFRSDAALQMAGTLSGGQMLRAGLACTLGGKRPPRLLILDEPTNHLDLDAIAAIEAGLNAYDGALLMVSHDETFLRNIGITRRLEL